MKIVITRFIIITMLIISSISVCLSNDNTCDDRPSYSQSQSAQSSSSSKDQNEENHCLCSLSCHNLLIGFTSSKTKSISIILSASPFIFIQVSYPQILISLDKPPIV